MNPNKQEFRDTDDISKIIHLLIEKYNHPKEKSTVKQFVAEIKKLIESRESTAYNTALEDMATELKQSIKMTSIAATMYNQEMIPFMQVIEDDFLQNIDSILQRLKKGSIWAVKY